MICAVLQSSIVLEKQELHKSLLYNDQNSFNFNNLFIEDPIPCTTQSPEKNVSHVSLNRRYVQTEHFFVLELYVCLGFLFRWSA